MPNRSTSKTLRTALALCALGWLLLLAPAAGARRPEYASTPEGRLRIFDEVWEQVSERYFDPSFHGVDWASLRAELRPRAADARGEAELYAVLRRLLGSLRDPHTRVYAPGESTDWRVHHYVSVGVAVRELSGQVVVTDVERDSPACRSRRSSRRGSPSRTRPTLLRRDSSPSTTSSTARPARRCASSSRARASGGSARPRSGASRGCASRPSKWKRRCTACGSCASTSSRPRWRRS